MDTTIVILVTTLAVGTALILLTYRMKQRNRVQGVAQRVREYLRQRYGTLPDELNVNCSDDARWPVLVSFVDPQSGHRQHLQFKCGASLSSFALSS